MKNRAVLILPLAAALFVPAFAQETNPSQTTPPTAQSEPQSQPSKDQLATGKEPLTYQSRQGFWGKINPFARKKYVQKQVQPIRDRVNELDELTAANSKMINDVDSRAQAGLRDANDKVSQADSHAVDAGNRAQQANQTAQQAGQRLQTVSDVVGNLDQYQAATQVEIRFRPGDTVLNKKAKDALDDFATQLKDQRGYVVEVQGFASGKGTAAVRSSKDMADSVVRYLVLSHEIPVYRVYTIGMGNAPVPVAASTDGTEAKAKTRHTIGGHVEVSLMRNGIADFNKQTASTASGPGAEK